MTRGFTVLELLCVFGIVALISSFSMYGTIAIVHNDRVRVTSAIAAHALRSARAAAMHNECLSSGCTKNVNHGVHISSSTLTSYEGLTYSQRNKDVDSYVQLSTSVDETTEVVFLPAGTIDSQTSLVFSDHTQSWVIDIQRDGGIYARTLPN
jgi:Tfp pilus assembly protein FimT